jgi:hypothetical protein
MAFPDVHHVRSRIRARHVVEAILPSVTVVVPILLLKILVSVLFELAMEGELGRLAIEKQRVVKLVPRQPVAACAGALPSNLVLETLVPEQLVQHHFDVVRGMIVAVVIE